MSEQIQPVEVTVKNYTDMVAKPRDIKKTTLHTYLIDPAGVTGLKNVQITDYEPKRIRTLIQVYDNPVALTTDSPGTSPDTSAADHTLSQGRLLMPDPSMVYEFWGPDAFFLNALQNPSDVVLPTLSGVVDARSTAFAAAAAGSINALVPGETITGVGVEFQAPAAPVLMTVTVSNILDGGRVFAVNVPVAGLNWRWPFTLPVAAATPGSTPSVAVAAQAGGPAYTIAAQFLKVTTMSRVTVTREYCA